MNFRKKSRVVFGVLLILSLHSKAFSAPDCYPNAPNILKCNVEAVTRLIVENNDPFRISTRLANLMFYSVADAVADANVLPPCDVEDYQHLGETARTDKQIGASSKSAGSTSLVEKPGFAQLLGFAIERGAIKQAIDGTTLTLSTSPYALLAAAHQHDTAALYQKYATFNRIGVSASFNITDTNNPLIDVSSKQLTEWSVRARLSGDRSSRGKDFQKFWDDNIGSFLQESLNAGNVLNTLIANDPFTRQLFVDFQTPGNARSIIDKIRTYLNSHASDSQDKKITDLKELILCELKQNVFDPIKLNPGQIGNDLRDQIPIVLNRVKAAAEGIKTAKALLEKFIKGLDDKPLSTFVYTNHREAMGFDYSELKFLYRSNLDPMKIIANAGISLYNNPNRALNQERVRDFNFALSLEGAASNPFARGEDLSKITFSFSGSYERFKEAEGMMMRKPDLASAQLKLEVPIATGLSIPVAYTYSSATEMSMKKRTSSTSGCIWIWISC